MGHFFIGSGTYNVYLSMGAIKNNNYNYVEASVSNAARAIAHPVRLKILEILGEHHRGCTNSDLADWLSFSKPTVKKINIVLI